MGRSAPGQSQVPRRQRGGGVPQLDQGGDCQEHALRSVLLPAVDRLRLEHGQPGGVAISRSCAIPDQAMENTTHLFLAMRFNCNKCHDHPFERWTQNQYYTTAGVFRADQPHARTPSTRAKRPKAPRCRARCRWSRSSRTEDAGRGQERADRPDAHRARSRSRIPACLTPRRRRREQLAKWITSKDNPYFAKSYVNRVWSYLLGVGHHRAGRRHPRRQPADQSATARPADRGVHQEQLQRASS